MIRSTAYTASRFRKELRTRITSPIRNSSDINRRLDWDQWRLRRDDQDPGSRHHDDSSSSFSSWQHELNPFPFTETTKQPVQQRFQKTKTNKQPPWFGIRSESPRSAASGSVTNSCRFSLTYSVNIGTSAVEDFTGCSPGFFHQWDDTKAKARFCFSLISCSGLFRWPDPTSLQLPSQSLCVYKRSNHESRFSFEWSFNCARKIPPHPSTPTKCRHYRGTNFISSVIPWFVCLFLMILFGLRSCLFWVENEWKTHKRFRIMNHEVSGDSHM